MGALFSIAIFLLGACAGWMLGARRVRTLRRESARRAAELRSHVLPLLEQRATTLGVPADRRARGVSDPLLAAITLGRAIREIESQRDLPYTDTVEVATDDVRAAVTRSGTTERRRA
jgi:hypothetical protein